MGGASLSILAMFHCHNVSCRKGPFGTSRGLCQHLSKSPACIDPLRRRSTSTRSSSASEQKHNQYNPPEILPETQDLSTGEDVDDAPFHPPDVESNNDDYDNEDDDEHNGEDDSDDQIMPSFVAPTPFSTTTTHTGDTNEPMTNSFPTPPKTFDLKNSGGKCPREWVKSWINWSEADSACHHQTDKKDNLSLLRKLLLDQSYKPGWNFVSKAEVAELKLLSILQVIPNCPLDTYQKIADWAQETYQRNSDDEVGGEFGNLSMPPLRSRERVLKSAITSSSMEDASPLETSLYLPGCGKSVRITRTSYTGALYSLLVSHQLVNDDTLLLNGATPYHDPTKEKQQILDDVDTGTRFSDAWFDLKVDPIDFPLPENLFIDKSVFDKNDRLSQEPVNYQFALVKRHARNRPASWRSLGTIPCFKSLGHVDGSNEKIADYHVCLEYILSGMKAEQTESRGILWPLMYKNILYMVRFKPYILAVLGDTLGQNVLAGKMAGPNCQMKCRYCNISKDQLSNPYANYSLMTQDIVDEIQTGDRDLLKIYSYKIVRNAFHSLRFGELAGKNAHGIHANLPPELLHTIQKGINKRCIECCLSTKVLNKQDKNEQKKVTRLLAKETKKNAREAAKASKGAKKAKKAPVTSSVKANKPGCKKPVKNSEQGLLAKVRRNDGRDYVFGGNRGRQMNLVSLQLGAWLTHQSDRDIPRVTFTKGIMTATKITAAEHQGLALLIVLTLCSTWALTPEFGLQDTMGEAKLGAYIDLLESLMCFEELIKSHPGKTSNPLKRSDIPLLRFYTKLLLEKIKATTERTEGDGWDIIKFHLILHMLEDMLKFGVPGNTSGGPGECQFHKKFHTMASTTQKRGNTFTKQVSERRHQRDAVIRRMEILERGGHVGDRKYTYQNFNPLATNEQHFALFADYMQQDLPTHFGESYYDAFPHDPQLLINDKGAFVSEDVENENGKPAPTERLRSEEKQNTGREASGGIYMMLWVEDTADSAPCTKCLEIVYCGKKETKLHNWFFKRDSKDHNFRSTATGKIIGCRGCIGLAKHNDEFSEIVSYFRPMFEEDKALQLMIYTTLKVEAETFVDTYRSDPLSHLDMKPRGDWAIFNWKGRHGKVPGQIRATIILDAQQAQNFNNTIAATSVKIHGEAIEKIKGPGTYALIHSLRAEVPGLLDPKFFKYNEKESLMQSNSVLFFYEEKEISPNKKLPLGRLVNCEMVVRPIVVLPDFSPMFGNDKNKAIVIEKWIQTEERKYAYIVMRPRGTWHEVFLAKAKREKEKLQQEDRVETVEAINQEREPDLKVKKEKTLTNLTRTQVRTALEEYKAEQAEKKKQLAEKKQKEKHDREIKQKETKASKNPEGMAEEIGKPEEECDADVVTVEDIASYYSEDDGCDDDECADEEEDNEIGVDEDDGEYDNTDDDEYL